MQWQKGVLMIKATKQRIMITIDKELLLLCRRAASEWDITLSEYLAHLAYVDITTGLTAQAREIAKSHERS